VDSRDQPPVGNRRLAESWWAGVAWAGGVGGWMVAVAAALCYGV